MNLTKFVRKLDLEQRKEFCRLAGTKHTHLWQLLGGHRAASLRMLTAMIEASKAMFPADGTVRARDRRWLTLEEVYADLQSKQLKRQDSAGENVAV